MSLLKEISITAVSYTHLDVYKRQMVFQAASEPKSEIPTDLSSLSPVTAVCR